MGKSNNNTRLIFESLVPSEDNELGVYETALNYVFENPDIKNVALSGAYGAGKSSVLASYKKKTVKVGRKYIHISLAHFEHDIPENGVEIKESVLEGKILNQLIHQIPESNIPQTNFRVKSATPIKVIIRDSAILLSLFLLLLHLTMSSKWETYIMSFQEGSLRNFLSLSTTPCAYFFSGIALCGIVAFFIYQIVEMQKNRRILKKLNLQGNEIEIFEDSDDSYFDKYLNEVLYLFENADADVIVFEDMDRFNAYQIFERLREVNSLINARSHGRTIRFFYLLKDDIFTSKDRTKFFDFIIPIVPIVDSSNSYDQFIAHFRKNHLVQKFDEHFLKGVSLYVDDMRLLKNICNEFLVYYDRLNTTELDYNKMLALITYKNLFPRDFSELQLGRGFVHTLFEQKGAFIEAEAKRLESIISAMEEKVNQMESEALRSSDEVEIVYDKKKAPLSRYYGHQREIEKLDAEMQKRKQQIEDKKNGKVNQLQQQIDQKKEELAVLRAQTLHEIINRENIDEIFHTEETDEIGNVNQFLDVKANVYFPILKYLIRNGYIDESYSDYMTYFYENSLSRTDKIFLRSITDCRAKEYQYELKDPKKVIEQLGEFDFDQEEVLNYCLIDYLLLTKPESVYVQHFVRQLQDKKRYDFIIGYLDVSKEPVEFVHQCNLHWKTPFQRLITDNELSIERLNQYAVLTLYSADTEAINLSNTENSLTEYISASTSFLDIDEPRIDCLIQGFDYLNVLFKRLEYCFSNKQLFMEVYENSLYDLCFENVREILMNIYGVLEDEIITHSNYSTIFSLSDTPIRRYVEANIEKYSDSLFKFCDGSIYDNNDAAVFFLNNLELSQSHKTQYLECLKVPLVDLALLEDRNLWSTAIDSEAVAFSEKNLLDYYNYCQKGDRHFVQLINMADRKIDFRELSSIREKDEITRLFETIISCDDIEDELYEQCVESLSSDYETFSISGLSTSKVLILVKYNVIPMNAESLTFMRSNYKEVISQYIESNINEYVALIDEHSFDYFEMLQVLSLDIGNELKLKLLELTEEPISIVDKGYSSTIDSYILANNLDDSDMPVLFKRYESYSPEIQSIIQSYLRRNPEELEACTDTCSLMLINDIFADSGITLENKSSILSALIPRLSKVQVIQYLDVLGLIDFARIFDSHTRPKFEITNENERLLDAFVKKGWIYEYIKETDGGDYYKIRRKKVRKSLTNNK